MNCGLQICALTAGYSKSEVIKSLDINHLARGKITALLGPNGCGKSTLLRSLAGLHKAKGQIFLDNIDLMTIPFTERAKKVVYLPQSLPAGVHLHVLESIIVAQRASGDGINGSCIDDIVPLLERLGIAHLAMRYLDQLSGGQKQLVGLAQSLVRQPSLLLLDEPLSALDLNYQYHVMDLIRQETKQRNIITVVVVHDINMALRYADHVLMLKKGELIASGLPMDVITAESLAKTYLVRGRIERCSLGIPQVFIDGLLSDRLC